MIGSRANSAAAAVRKGLRTCARVLRHPLFGRILFLVIVVLILIPVISRRELFNILAV
jgi:hypothetical protein